MRSTSFQSLLPLLAFKWGSKLPRLNSILMITTLHAQTATYHLRGIIYHNANHFTAHVIDTTSQMWYHDGMQTGPQRTLTLKQNMTCPHPNAIVAVYSHEWVFLYLKELRHAMQSSGPLPWVQLHQLPKFSSYKWLDLQALATGLLSMVEANGPHAPKSCAAMWVPLLDKVAFHISYVCEYLCFHTLSM